MTYSLAFADWRNPLSPGHWSGTSGAVAAAFRASGTEIIGLECRPSLPRLLNAYAIDAALGHERDYTQRRLGPRVLKRLTRSLPSACTGIVHMNSVSAPARGCRCGKPHYMLLDSLCEYWRRFSPSDHTSRGWKEFEDCERLAVSGIDHFFSISDHIKQLLVGHYGIDGERVTVVGTGRGNIKPLDGEKDYTRKNVLMVAKQRFGHKGVRLIVEAMAHARRNDPDITLTLVAPDHIAQEVGAVAGVRVTGTLPWDELQALFDTATLYAMPAPCEPWGLVYVEALATKTPVLGLNRASLPEITANGRFGFLVDEETPEAVGAALVDAASDPVRLRRMGVEGQAHVLDTFSWQRTAELMHGKIFASL